MPTLNATIRLLFTSILIIELSRDLLLPHFFFFRSLVKAAILPVRP